MSIKSSESKLSRKEWKILIFGGMIAVAFPLIFDFLKGYPFLTSINRAIAYITNKLKYEVPIWKPILVVIIVYLFYKLVQFTKIGITILRRREDKKVQGFQHWTRYKFKEWTWTWSYKFYIGKWNVDRLRAFCPKCGTTMLFNEDVRWPEYRCPNCSFSANDRQAENIAEIEALIVDAIDQKKYISMMNNK